MDFNLAENTEGVLFRCVSEGGRWEMGWQDRTFGRKQWYIARVGNYAPDVVYCCGDDKGKQIQLMAMCMLIMKTMPEDINYKYLQKRFPSYQQRPIYNDPICWTRLEEMSGVKLERLESGFGVLSFEKMPTH